MLIKRLTNEVPVIRLMANLGCPVINKSDDCLVFECPLRDEGRCGADLLVNPEKQTFVCTGRFCHLQIKEGNLTQLIIEVDKVTQPEAEAKLMLWGIEPVAQAVETMFPGESII